jgi:hypothetical protein
MAEKIISAEPGASAGNPGNGRAEAEVNRSPMKNCEWNQDQKVQQKSPIHVVSTRADTRAKRYKRIMPCPQAKTAIQTNLQEWAGRGMRCLQGA